MTIILTILGLDVLDNGEPATLTLDRRGAVIGRSGHADWSLPDPKNHISSRHCEISYRDGVYLITDRSTNGTFLNGSPERLVGAHPISDEDHFTIGGYEIIARCPTGEIYAEATSEQGHSVWSNWSPPVETSLPEHAWEGPPSPVAADSGWNIAPVAPPVPNAGGWDTPAPTSRPSAWSSEPREDTPPSASDIWGQLADQNDIDWSRGDFGPATDRISGWGQVAPDRLPSEASERSTWQTSEKIGAPKMPAPSALPPSNPNDDSDALHSPYSSVRADADGPSQSLSSDGWQAFLAGTGIALEQVRSKPVEMLFSAGAVLRQMVVGLVLMVEARARAKAQLGLQGTSLELDGNNPLKFIRSPDRALLQLLESPERGFMTAARAVEDAYQDLQAHQMATLGAMRGALSDTLARFSPAAIRQRQKGASWIAKLLPRAHDAALWQSYEHEFEGVVRGADEAFMDVFSKEFRAAYEFHISEMNVRRRERSSQTI